MSVAFARLLQLAVVLIQPVRIQSIKVAVGHFDDRYLDRKEAWRTRLQFLERLHYTTQK